MVQFLNQVQSPRKGKLPLLMHRLVTPSRKLQTWLTWAHRRCAKWRRRLSKQPKIHRQSGLKSAGLGRRGMLLRWKRLAWKPQSHFAHKIVINIWYWQVCSAQATKRIQEANLFYLQAAEESSKRAKEREQLSQPEPESLPVSIDPLFFKEASHFVPRAEFFTIHGGTNFPPTRNTHLCWEMRLANVMNSCDRFFWQVDQWVHPYWLACHYRSYILCSLRL